MNRSLGVAAAIGAGVTLVSGVLPFVQLIAPVVGGSAAAYLSDASPKEGIKIGGAAGVLTLLVYLPVFLLGAIAIASFAATTSAVSGAEVGIGLATLPLLLLLTVLVPATSALGGALGSVVSERRHERTSDPVANADAAGSEMPIERLERRYVEGEIDESGFEHRLDTILESRRRYDKGAKGGIRPAGDEYATSDTELERE